MPSSSTNTCTIAMTMILGASTRSLRMSWNQFPEEDESEAEESEEEGSMRREELGRPRTPEPSSLGMQDDYERGA